MLEKYDAFDRVVLASFHGEIYREFKRLKKQDLVPDSFMFSPGMIGIGKYYALMTLGMDALFTDGIAVLQIPMEEYGFNFATSRMITSAHARGVAVQYWTIDDEDEMRLLIELGADGIMTDNPSVLKKVLEEYKIDEPYVKYENFNNPEVEREITGAIDAITRAKFELTVEYDITSVSYDENANMWCVTFWTLDMPGGDQSVYLNGNGLTCYIIYGE